MKKVTIKVKVILTVFALFVAATENIYAGLTDELGEFLGYKIVAQKTIAGEFEGCDYDKVIKFSDGTALNCMSYGYQYGYMPTAIILFNGSNIKMIVEDEVYDMVS